MSYLVRITLKIDDEVIAAAQKLAAERKTTIDQGISDAARNELVRADGIVRNGFPVPKTGRVVTPELIEQLLEEADWADAGLPGNNA